MRCCVLPFLPPLSPNDDAGFFDLAFYFSVARRSPCRCCQRRSSGVMTRLRPLSALANGLVFSFTSQAHRMFLHRIKNWECQLQCWVSSNHSDRKGNSGFQGHLLPTMRSEPNLFEAWMRRSITDSRAEPKALMFKTLHLNTNDKRTMWLKLSFFPATDRRRRSQTEDRAQERNHYILFTQKTVPDE